MPVANAVTAIAAIGLHVLPFAAFFLAFVAFCCKALLGLQTFLASLIGDSE